MSAYKVIQKFVRSHDVKKWLFIFLVFLISAFLVFELFKTENVQLKTTVKKIKLKDWHDYEQQKEDDERTGDGEFGEPIQPKLEPTNEDVDNFNIHGFNTYISDRISPNRSVPDLRHRDCLKKLYPEKLPSVSVIFIFHNEYSSVLIRSIHSVVNRTPSELLHEIILVDDCSTYHNLKEPLDSYIKRFLPKDLVKIVRFNKKKGLMAARAAGARLASAAVLVFFDSHIETNYNWLPPLLAPLIADRKTVTLPLIDAIHHSTFQYESQDEGARGAFDWAMEYKRLPLAENVKKHPTEPFPTPIMAGGLFAIARDYFWHLGGYDPSLVLWGAEQYELSFKIWMCGGRILEVPCSRVGHIYRLNGFAHDEPKIQNFLHYNIKRVAEVWMDEYKEVVYKKDKLGIYDSLDVGDLSAQKQLRAQLQCKSFDWFLKEIAPEILQYYPTEWPEPYAYGILQSLAQPELCLDSMTGQPGSIIGLKTCSKDLDNPVESQNWELSHFRDLRPFQAHFCVESMGVDIISPIQLVDCHQPHSSIWYYDRMNFWIRMHYEGMHCLEALPRRMSVRINKCDKENRQLRWHFGNVNHSALNQFDFN